MKDRILTQNSDFFPRILFSQNCDSESKIAFFPTCCSQSESIYTDGYNRIHVVMHVFAVGHLTGYIPNAKILQNKIKFAVLQARM